MTNTNVKPFTGQLKAKGKIPIIQHIPRSYAMLLRDGMVTRLKAMPFYAGWTFATSTAFPIMPEHIPYAGVYFVDESLSPDGLADSGEPRFHSIVQVAFSMMVQNNDPEVAENKLDDAYQVITGGLFSDPTLYNNEHFQIQGYARGRRAHVFGGVGKNNEQPICELQFRLSVDLGAIIWEPLVPDMLEVIHVKTVYPDDDPKRQPVISEYDLWP